MLDSSILHNSQLSSMSAISMFSSSVIRRFLLAVLVCLAALAVAYATWPMWSPALVRTALKQVGVDVSQIDLPRPSFDALEIKHFELKRSARAFILRAEGNGLVLRYHVAGLLRAQFDELHVDDITVAVQPITPAVDAPGSPSAIAFMPPSAFLSKLPVTVITSPILNIDVQLASAIQHFAGNADYRDGRLQLALASTAMPSLAAQLRLDKRDQLELTVQRDQALLLHLANQIEPPRTLQGDVTLQFEPLSALLHDWGLLAQATRLSGRLKSSWRGALPELLDAHVWQNATLTGELDARFAASDASRAGEASLKLEYGLAQSTLQIAEGAQLALEKGRWPGGSSGPIEVRTGKPMALALAADRLSLPAAQFDIGPVELTQQGKPYRFAAAQLVLQEGALDLQAIENATASLSLHLSQLSGSLGAYQVQPMALQVDLKLAHKALQGDWTLHAGKDVFVLNGSLLHSFADASGELTATLPPLSFQENGRYLPALFVAWPYPFDLSAGQLGGKTRLKWRPSHWSAQFDMALKALGGFYNLNLFKGLSAQIHADLEDGKVTMPATVVTLAELNAGIALRELHFTAAVTSPETLHVQDLQAKLLGGRLFQPAFDYRWTAASNTLPLSFEALQLDQLLSLEQNVEGNGILDGELPLTLTQTGISVQAGQFQARAPGGVIRYQGDLSKTALAAVPALQLSLDSLKNFHYDGLKVQADYAPSGDLALRTELQGRNPDLAEKRPIRFNLTIHENIPDLLRSIQLSRDIGDSIEKRIQEFYQRQPRESSQ
ncbi:MAG TPA: YdbH domain-containing protein [Pseudomonadales bacterium]|nr:YdbH domain-containing protein [Pseudomonadales bacterium]